MSNLKPLIVILGPTASGKTEVGLRLAKKYDGEIVNADSRQIYEDMLIGTGSPVETKNEKRKTKNCNLKCKNNFLKPAIINNIPHHFFHFIEPNHKFSVAEYKSLAVDIIHDIHKRNKIPILVGGTGLYISAIVDNLKIPKAAPNNKIRNKLEKHTNKYLFGKLQKIDPKSAGIIGENNKRKLIRALEVFEITGKPFSAQQIKGEPLFNTLQIGIKTDREKLYKNIDKRVDEMMKIGLVEETKKLRKKHSFDLSAMSGIGYFEIEQYLKKIISLDEAIQKMKYRTHHYARRQMTWFKRDERIRWVGSYRETEKLIREFLKNLSF
jgi:tRNA dimethylallyltransferase